MTKVLCWMVVAVAFLSVVWLCIPVSAGEDVPKTVSPGMYAGDHCSPLEETTSLPNSPSTPGYPKITPPSVAVCDPHRAFDEHKATIEAMGKLAAEIKVATEQVRAKFKLVNAKKKEIDSLKKKKGKQYDSLTAQLVTLSTDARVFQAVANTRFATTKREIASGGYIAIYEATAKIAKERGINLVLTRDYPKLKGNSMNDLLNNLYNRRSVLYADESLDITDDVIKELNKE